MTSSEDFVSLATLADFENGTQEGMMGGLDEHPRPKLSAENNVAVASAFKGILVKIILAGRSNRG